MQFDALLAKLKAAGCCSVEDLDHLISHVGRMRAALFPFTLLAMALGEGSGVSLDGVHVDGDDFAAAVEAYDAPPECVPVAVPDGVAPAGEDVP